MNKKVYISLALFFLLTIITGIAFAKFENIVNGNSANLQIAQPIFNVTSKFNSSNTEITNTNGIVYEVDVSNFNGSIFIFSSS